MPTNPAHARARQPGSRPPTAEATWGPPPRGGDTKATRPSRAGGRSWDVGGRARLASRLLIRAVRHGGGSPRPAFTCSSRTGGSTDTERMSAPRYKGSFDGRKFLLNKNRAMMWAGWRTAWEPLVVPLCVTPPSQVLGHHPTPDTRRGYAPDISPWNRAEAAGHLQAVSPTAVT